MKPSTCITCYFTAYFPDRLEERKREKKPEVKDAKVKELQQKLESRKAGESEIACIFVFLVSC